MGASKSQAFGASKVPCVEDLLFEKKEQGIRVELIDALICYTMSKRECGFVQHHTVFIYMQYNIIRTCEHYTLINQLGVFCTYDVVQPADAVLQTCSVR